MLHLNLDAIANKIIFENNLIKGEKLGIGGFGIIYEVYHRELKEVLAAKLVEKNKNSQYNEAEISKEICGPNIVKFYDIYETKIDNHIYNLILMEKAPLKDLYIFNNIMRNENAMKLIFLNPFDIIGDNLLRFFFKQIIQGLETLDRGNFVHFNIKPQNFLIFNDMTLKLCDFCLLRNITSLRDLNNNIQMPGGTFGYLSPEYYKNNHIINMNEANKQDFFALGATLFFMKYGKEMIKFLKVPKSKNRDLIIADYLTEEIQDSMEKIKATKSSSKSFIDFLCSLIQFNPKDRPSFEEIYRNKWINKNWKELVEICQINSFDEQKLIIEINKSDFLIKKKKKIDIHRTQNYNNRNANDNNNRFHIYNHTNKFIFRINRRDA